MALSTIGNDERAVLEGLDFESVGNVDNAPGAAGCFGKCC